MWQNVCRTRSAPKVRQASSSNSVRFIGPVVSWLPTVDTTGSQYVPGATPSEPQARPTIFWASVYRCGASGPAVFPPVAARPRARGGLAGQAAAGDQLDATSRPHTIADVVGHLEIGDQSAVRALDPGGVRSDDDVVAGRQPWKHRRVAFDRQGARVQEGVPKDRRHPAGDHHAAPAPVRDERDVVADVPQKGVDRALTRGTGPTTSPTNATGRPWLRKEAIWSGAMPGPKRFSRRDRACSGMSALDQA